MREICCLRGFLIRKLVKNIKCGIIQVNKLSLLSSRISGGGRIQAHLSLDSPLFNKGHCEHCVYSRRRPPATTRWSAIQWPATVTTSSYTPMPASSKVRLSSWFFSDN